MLVDITGSFTPLIVNANESLDTVIIFGTLHVIGEYTSGIVTYILIRTGTVILTGIMTYMMVIMTVLTKLTIIVLTT